MHRMPFGADIEENGGVRFRIYAPTQPSVKLALEGREPLAMQTDGTGWHELTTGEAKSGSRYRYQLGDGTQVPDPVSRYQPEDVSGASEVIDPRAYAWKDTGWSGRPWNEAILYELHVGTFTKEGTFRSAIARLDHLAELGVTALELMCIAEFPGNRNWGYDGTLFYATDSAYGRPEEVKAFIDAAHARNIMIILDVVYNHFGPEGNYMPQYFPDIVTDRHKTPWGQSLNFDGQHSDVVRDYVIHNALYWLEEFHADGLRLDASHAMIDDSPKHVLDELRERVDTLSNTENRYIHLILENETNIANKLQRDGQGKPTNYSAQWNHDITHLLSAAFGNLCSSKDGAEEETGKLAKALTEGFVIAAQMQGAPPEPHVPPTAFIAFIQTHDLIGNRVFGERISALVPPHQLHAIAAICLLLPQIPMLFMGEEWAATTPFPFFCDYHGDLAEAVRKGRCEQLSKLNPAPSQEELNRAPNPQDDATLRSAQLKWDELQQPEHAAWFDWYKRILAVRHESILPLLASLPDACGTFEVIAPGALKAHWTFPSGAELHLAANLCDQPNTLGPAAGRTLWLEGSEDNNKLNSWTIRWTLVD